MKEQDFFDIMDGLPARQIAEAAEWKYRHGGQQENEIDALLKNSTVSEPVKIRQTAPEVRGTAADPVTAGIPTAKEPQSRMLRSVTLGMAAVAAAFTLIVGGIAFKLHRDNTDVTAPQTGTTIATGTASVTTDFDSDVVPVTDAPQDSSSAVTTSATTVTFSPAAAPVTLAADDTVSAGELNFLGGHGPLRPITPNDSNVELFQDDDYIYLDGSERIPKEKLSPTGTSGELICQTPGCAHNTEDCPYFRYGNGQLICGNHELYYCDFGMSSPKLGFSGGLERIFSDGSTENVFSMTPQASKALEIGIEEIGIAHYLNIIRLGDTGIYLLDMYYSPFERDGEYTTTSTNSGIYELVLLDSRTGKTIPMNYLCEERFMTQLVIQYDETEQRLFVSNAQNSFLKSVLEIDIYTGNLIAEYALSPFSIDDWFYAEGKLHYLCSSGKGQPRGTTAWSTVDLETFEKETVMENCKLRSFCYYDGRVYAVRHESVGMDAVVSYAPDGTDEQVIAETKGSLDAISQVFDPERITVYSATNTLDMYLTDPEKGIVKLTP